MFNKDELDKWFQEKFQNDYSIHRPDHPMCRCSIITTKPAQIMVFMPDVTKALVKEYIEECKGLIIWIN